MHEDPAVTTFLFTDIEGSTRLWEEDAARMQAALAKHDAIVRTAVEAHCGVVVKMTGDGVHAAFDDPLDALCGTLQLQQALADPTATDGVALPVRCGLHAGAVERRDSDFYGPPVNRTARIMSVAHGGQILISQTLAALLSDRLPEGIGLRDLGAVRLRDLADPVHVHQVLHPQLRHDFPALRSLEATPNNLPQQVTSFVGREREEAEVKALLRGTRLLTLLGVGGLGKTRLSLQVAADVMDGYPDGVWFVDLAPLSDPGLMPQAVASVLGVKEEAGRPVQEALAKYVRERQLLLVLDNCEHLLHACAGLAKHLLQSGPRLTILATSREHLHVAGETTYPMPSLSVPDAQNAIPVEALAQFESVRLFIDRAEAAQPTFRLTAQNASAVADICRRLDGIPLAIELAAARVRALSVEKIAARLSDRFRLLTGGDKTALPRQQTLRALIDWSYDLLTPSERTLLRRLAVFAGGWTLEAAEGVGAGGEIDESEVLDLLANLVEKSLAVLAAEGERYRLLETVRQYAQERLFESGDGNTARARHLAFYLAFAERARPELVGTQQATWLRRIDADAENLLAAHAWCDQAEGGALFGLRLASSLRRYMMMRGLLALGYRVTLEALDRAGAQERSAARCWALFDAGQLGSWMGRYGDAQRYLEESLEIARELGDKRGVAAALQPLALAAFGLGDVAKARGHLDEALALAQERGVPRDAAAVLNALAQIHRMQGEQGAAQSLYERAIALLRELGDRENLALALLNLAMVSIDSGCAQRSVAMLEEALVIAQDIGSKPAGQSVLDVCAGLAAFCEQWEYAARLFGAAEAHKDQTGIHRDPADEAFLLPLVERARAALGATTFAASEASGRQLSYNDTMAWTRAWLAGLGLSPGERFER